MEGATQVPDNLERYRSFLREGGTDTRIYVLSRVASATSFCLFSSTSEHLMACLSLILPSYALCSTSDIRLGSQDVLESQYSQKAAWRQEFKARQASTAKPTLRTSKLVDWMEYEGSDCYLPALLLPHYIIDQVLVKVGKHSCKCPNKLSVSCIPLSH